MIFLRLRENRSCVALNFTPFPEAKSYQHQKRNRIVFVMIIFVSQFFNLVKIEEKFMYIRTLPATPTGGFMLGRDGFVFLAKSNANLTI